MLPRKSPQVNKGVPDSIFSTETSLREHFSEAVDIQNIKIGDVLAFLGLKNIDFHGLPEDVKQEIITLVRIAGERMFWAVPPVRILAGLNDWPENFQVASAEGNDNIYFYFDVTNDGERQISISRFRRKKKGLKAENIANSDSVDKCIRAILMHDPLLRIAEGTRVQIENKLETDE